jgi:hypothetical protein
MIFALDTDDGAVKALASAAEAGAHCKPIDVEDGYWLFFADDGSPLEARFERAARPGSDAALPTAFTLQRAMSGLWLQERLDRVSAVNGCGLSSVEQLAETLRINRGKRIPPPPAKGLPR